MKLVVSAKMGPGTFEAKFLPLSLVEMVEEIVVVRKEPGPAIPKLSYHILPALCRYPIVNACVTPFILAAVAKKHKAGLLLAYHYTPHFYFVYVASLLTGVPYILGQTGLYIQRFFGTRIGKITLGHIIRKALQLNVPGTSSRDFWNLRGFTNVQVLHSTIDTDRFLPVNQEKDIDFLYLGRLEIYKGVQHILHAFRNVVDAHPDANLAIVGYGSYESELKKLATSLGLSANVDFLGFQADTNAFYRRSKVFVMASETEGLPCSLMEAMSCELLCISSLVGNIADILIDGVTGFGFTSGDVNRLSVVMAQSYADYDSYLAMRSQARNLIEREHSYHFAKKLWESVLVREEHSVHS